MEAFALRGAARRDRRSRVVPQTGVPQTAAKDDAALQNARGDAREHGDNGAGGAEAEEENFLAGAAVPLRGEEGNGDAVGREARGGGFLAGEQVFAQRVVREQLREAAHKARAVRVTGSREASIT